MALKDLKYLAAFILPIGAFFSINNAGLISFLPLLVAFIIIPILEIILPKQAENISKEEAILRKNQLFFDLLLYLNLPVVLGLMVLYFSKIDQFTGPLDWIGNTGSLALIMSACGINVAHELGHKNSAIARTTAKALLLPSLYMHFIIEHNLGHHLRVSTPEDPATARFGENIYSFWIRSTYFSYLSAWKIENKIQRKKHKKVFNLGNRMIQFSFIQTMYLIIVYSIFDLIGLITAIILATISFLILETINYIEHYGLMRRKKENGKYEMVTHKHSWNSDHQLGRIILYELTRHSDHHYKSTKKYQTLNSHAGSPELPFGYPGSLLLSLIPPLWFKVMNEKVEYWSR